MTESSDAAVMQALEEGRSVVLRARGGSMGVSIPDGSRVRIDVAVRPRLGRIVAVRRPDGGLAIHRFVGRASGRAITWGDAMPRPDSWRSAVLLGEVEVMSSSRPATPRAVLSGLARAASHVAAGVAMSLWDRCSSPSDR